MAVVHGIGVQGKQTSNSERDLHTRMPKYLNIPVKPHFFDTVRYHKQSGKSKLVTGAIICPHDILGALHRHSRLLYYVLGARDQWVAFWKANAQETWFVEHPDRAAMERSPWLYAPFLIFGDDAQTCKRVGSNVKLLCWFSPVSEARESFHRLLPIYMCPTKERNTLAIQRRAEVSAVWSFEAAARNKNPQVSDLGGPLCAERERVAGNDICEDTPVFLTYAGNCGDWKWQVEQCP